MTFVLIYDELAPDPSLADLGHQLLGLADRDPRVVAAMYYEQRGADVVGVP